MIYNLPSTCFGLYEAIFREVVYNASTADGVVFTVRSDTIVNNVKPTNQNQNDDYFFLIYKVASIYFAP